MGTRFAKCSSMSHFRKKLDIRLLKIKPIPQSQSDFDLRSPLNVDVITVSLPRAPSYLALSYVWGDPTPCRPILCNDASMLITENLDRALWTVSCSIGSKKCEMWKKGKAIYLWADGICICQNDNEEKSNQVAMMGDIYRMARGVIGYAGAPTAGDPRDAILGLISFLGRNQKSSMFPNEKAGSDLCVSGWLHTALTDQVMREFWTNQWLIRAWVAQEVALAAKLYVMYGVGSNHAIWSLDAIDRIGSDLDNVPHLSQLLVHSSNQDLIYRTKSSYSWRSHLRKYFATGNIGPSLVELLFSNRATETANPKDKIYAILGLASPNVRKYVVVGYSDGYSFRELLLDVSKLCVGRGDVEALLVLAENSAESNLPSWIPELSWGARTGVRDNLLSYRCSKVPIKASLDHAGDELRIRGYVVDHTPKFGPGITITGGQPRISERRVSVGTQSASRDLGERLSLDLDDWNNVEIIRRTITLDLGPKLTTQKISEVHQTEYYVKYLATVTTPVLGEESDLGPPRDDDTPVNDIHDQIWRGYQLAKCRWDRCESRFLDPATKLRVQDALKGAVPYFHGMKLASNYCGRLAVVPEATQSSDLVAIFNGCHVLFVVRPTKNSKYQLIGSCYLHGVMRGEMKETLPSERAKGRLLEQDFLLV